MRKVLRGEKAGVALNYGDAYGRQLGAQNVRAVAWGVHPHSVYDGWSRADGDVFGDHAETRACLARARKEVWLTGKLVRHLIELSHADGMLTRGRSEGIVPLKDGEALGDAFTVQGAEKLAFRGGDLRLGGKQGPRSHQKDGGEQCEGACELRHIRTPLEMALNRLFAY